MAPVPITNPEEATAQRLRTRASAAVRRTNLSASIADRIAEQIVSGKLRPGTRLQSERELCDLYGVGRSSIREAVKALESRGLVAGRQGEGRYVKAPELSGLVQPPCGPLAMTENDVRYLYEARRIVEPAMCALAAERAAARDVEAATRLLEEHEARIASGSYGGAEDTAFHMTLAAMADNPLLARLLEAILAALHTTREPALRSAGGLRFSLAGHWDVMNAVAAHDAEAAREAMLAHLGRAERSAIEIVRRREQSESAS